VQDSRIGKARWRNRCDIHGDINVGRCWLKSKSELLMRSDSANDFFLKCWMNKKSIFQFLKVSGLNPSKLSLPTTSPLLASIGRKLASRAAEPTLTDGVRRRVSRRLSDVQLSNQDEVSTPQASPDPLKALRDLRKTLGVSVSPERGTRVRGDFDQAARLTSSPGHGNRAGPETAKLAERNSRENRINDKVKDDICVRKNNRNDKGLDGGQHWGRDEGQLDWPRNTEEESNQARHRKYLDGEADRKTWNLGENRDHKSHTNKEDRFFVKDYDDRIDHKNQRNEDDRLDRFDHKNQRNEDDRLDRFDHKNQRNEDDRLDRFDHKNQRNEDDRLDRFDHKNLRNDA
jgi:hypothetical protein